MPLILSPDLDVRLEYNSEMGNKLPNRQARFVAEYLIDLNATKAAIRAGYSKKTAYSQGQRLLKNVEVASQVADKTGKRLDRLEISADRVLQELAKLALWPGQTVHVLPGRLDVFPDGGVKGDGDWVI